VDVSSSYREAAHLAASRYLALLGLTPPVLAGDAYDAFKRMGGFNDDWDLTTGIIEALLSGLPAAPALPRTRRNDLDTLLSALRNAAFQLHETSLPSPDWEHWIAAVQFAGGGLDGLRRVTGGRNAHLLSRGGDPAVTDLVQRVFSEIYLGDALFAECYGFPACFTHGPGLIKTESLLIGRETLDALAAAAPLGIATGRTRFELAQAFRAHGLAPYFGAVATYTDALEAQGAGPSLLKPHPYLLRRAADALDPPRPGRPPAPAVYVGDSPDDIVAARRADGARRWTAVGVSPEGSALRARQLALGADHVIAHPDELMQLF
jgi:phosphoglycolate phosphatase-like HAD superfamily hydrolase